ncbi:hypothetical protein [Flavobacterium sp.]|uniref:hypothetical protein n=1 Tax=Flavobacterium sp. TaxID=239 RepID=UPI0037513815
MIKDKLNATIYNINNDIRFLISILDLKNNKSLYRFYEATRIIKEFGSGENFFEYLNAEGYHDLRISSHIKNGTGKKKIADTYTATIIPKGQIVPVEAVAETVETPQSLETSETTEIFEKDPIPMETIPMIPEPPIQPKPTMALDMFSNFGLGAPQIMELMVKKSEAERLLVENSELKTEVKTLREKNEINRETILQDKYNYDKEKDKKTSNSEILGQLAGSLPTILNYISPNAGDGLGGTKPTDYGSETKNNFAEQINSIDDETLKLLTVMVETWSNNPQFSDELIELLKKFKLWQ